MIKTNEILKEKSAMEAIDANLDYDQLAQLGKLAAGIAHEIRNPLTTIKGFLELLKPYLKDLGKEEYADIALNEIKRINEIIYEFLHTVKPSDDKKEMVSINKIVTNLVKFFECEAIIKNVQLTTHITEEQIFVIMKENEMKQVLINLIKNSLEAIEICNDRIGCIEIRTEVVDKHGYIHIIDNGGGMSYETENKLFTPFYSTKTTGTGIGLSICKKIIENHNGQIYITTVKDKGTKFTIELPILK